jgi:hypothetical protein
MQTTSARNVMRVYALSIDDAEDKIQLTNFSFDNEFIDMTVLTDSLTHDLLLQGIADVEKCMLWNFQIYLKMTVLLLTPELILLVEMLLYV